MGFLKKIEKAVQKHPMIAGILASSPEAPPGLGGVLSEHLAAERKQHEIHDKVKEIHHHYHDKKHK